MRKIPTVLLAAALISPVFGNLSAEKDSAEEVKFHKTMEEVFSNAKKRGAESSRPIFGRSDVNAVMADIRLNFGYLEAFCNYPEEEKEAYEKTFSEFELSPYSIPRSERMVIVIGRLTEMALSKGRTDLYERFIVLRDKIEGHAVTVADIQEPTLIWALNSLKKKNIPEAIKK